MTTYCCDALKTCIERWDTIADDEVLVSVRSGQFIGGNPVIMHLWKLTDKGQISRRAGSKGFAYLTFCPFCGTRLRPQWEPPSEEVKE